MAQIVLLMFLGLKRERWDTLTLTITTKKFPPIAPDFCLELMSPTDRLKETQDKLKEYMDNALKLGWLINRKLVLVEIYLQGQILRC
jgi:Uma2 family endonuclease